MSHLGPFSQQSMHSVYICMSSDRFVFLGLCLSQAIAPVGGIQWSVTVCGTKM